MFEAKACCAELHDHYMYQTLLKITDMLTINIYVTPLKIHSHELYILVMTFMCMQLVELRERLSDHDWCKWSEEFDV